MKLILLDLRTLAVVLMVVTAFLSLTMYFIWRVQKTYPGFGWWTLANLVAAVGFALLSLRGMAPDFLSIILGNTLAIVSNLLCVEGNHKFLGLKDSKWIGLGATGAYFLLISYFTYQNDNVIHRIAVSSLFIGSISAYNWFIFSRNTGTQRSYTYQFARLTYLGITTLMLLRILGTYTISDIKDFYAPDIVQSIVYLTFIVFAVLWTFQYVILNNERLQKELQTAQIELEQLATTDFLTGLHNRRNFLEIGRREVQRARRFRHPLTVVMFDIDYFKKVNDTHGHATGDLVLTEIAALCQKNLRGSDVLGRLGGEEFAVLLPHTRISDASTIAEHLRTMIAQSETVLPAETIKITASFGVSALKDTDEEIEAVLRRADALLYQAKNQGRNRVAAETAEARLTKSAVV